MQKNKKHGVQVKQKPAHPYPLTILTYEYKPLCLKTR